MGFIHIVIENQTITLFLHISKNDVELIKFIHDLFNLNNVLYIKKLCLSSTR